MNRLKELINEYYELGIPEQIDHEKFYLYSIITHSTAIEGSTITEIENQLLFDEGISSGKSIAEQLMNLDLKAAYEEAFQMVERNENITVENLCLLSGKVMKNTGSSYNTIAGSFNSADGDLRLLNVSAGYGGRSYIAWQKVSERLEKFCDWLNSKRYEIEEYDLNQIYDLSFEAHYHLVSIHPWADGNGRMARLVMNMIQYEAGVPLSVVQKESRAAYIESLSQSQEEDSPQPFLDFMIHHHISNLEREIKQYKQTLENDTLKSQNDTLNDTLNRAGKLSSAEKNVLNAISENPETTIEIIIQKTSLSRATVNRAIRTMKEKGILKRIGSKKTGRWKIG